MSISSPRFHRESLHQKRVFFSIRCVLHGRCTGNLKENYSNYWIMIFPWSIWWWGRRVGLRIYFLLRRSKTPPLGPPSKERDGGISLRRAFSLRDWWQNPHFFFFSMHGTSLPFPADSLKSRQNALMLMVFCSHPGYRFIHLARGLCLEERKHMSPPLTHPIRCPSSLPSWRLTYCSLQ